MCHVEDIQKAGSGRTTNEGGVLSEKRFPGFDSIRFEFKSIASEIPRHD